MPSYVSRMTDFPDGDHWLTKFLNSPTGNYFLLRTQDGIAVPVVRRRVAESCTYVAGACALELAEELRAVNPGLAARITAESGAVLVQDPGGHPPSLAAAKIYAAHEVGHAIAVWAGHLDTEGEQRFLHEVLAWTAARHMFWWWPCEIKRMALARTDFLKFYAKLLPHPAKEHPYYQWIFRPPELHEFPEIERSLETHTPFSFEFPGV